jgi:hypothetical protein
MAVTAKQLEAERQARMAAWAKTQAQRREEGVCSRCGRGDRSYAFELCEHCWADYCEAR